MVPKAESDSGINPEAARRCAERYNAKVAEDRRARLDEAMKRLDAAFGDYNAIDEDLCKAAGTTPAAAERLIVGVTARLGDAAFLPWRVAGQPRPSMDQELRARANAAEHKMRQALFDAVKIDKTVLSHPVIVDWLRWYQDLGNVEFFAELGAAVAKPGGLHRSKDIDVAILGFAGREVGYSYAKIANLLAAILDRPDIDPDAVRKALERHGKSFSVEVKA